MPSSDHDLAVVIPAFNAVRTLAASIASAREVGVRSIIVVDDGSTDDTASLADSLGCSVISQVNSGAAAARRTGINAVTNEFVVLLDADDALVPAGVAESVALLSSQPDAVASQGVTIGMDKLGTRRELRLWSEGVTVPTLINRGHAPGPPAAFVWRSSTLRAVINDTPPGVWPRFAEDYEFILRGATHGRIVSHHTVACMYQWSGGKSSAAPERSVLDAEKIRMHYALSLGIRVQPRSVREIKSLIWMRRSAAFTSRETVHKRAFCLVAAVLCNPVGVGERVLLRIRKTKRA
jgi:hypothetical protein